MRFLLVNYEYPPIGGGAATATQAIARELAALGHHAVVLTASFDQLPAVEEAGNVTVRRVPSVRKAADRSGIGEMMSFVASASAFAPRVVREHEIEAAIIFFSFPCGPIGLLLNAICEVPYVVSLRGGDVPGAEPRLHNMHRLLIPLRRAVLEQSVAVVANSDGLKRMSEAADPVRVEVIPNGVDTSAFHPAANRPAHGRLRLLFVGRFQEQKNLGYLFEQLSRLPGGSFELQLVGDGPLRVSLQELASRLGIADALTWHGWRSRAELAPIYQSADVLVNPSLYEGMPNVVLEAMACGLPVVASNVPGNDAVVVHGETGYLFDLDEPDALLHAVRTLLHDRTLLTRFGATARERAVNEFSWRTVAQSYAALFP